MQALSRGEYGRAEIVGNEALALFRALDDTGQTAESLWLLGIAAQQQGDFDRAAAFLEESVVLSRERGAATSLGPLGLVALNRGDVADARVQLTEALETLRRHGHRSGQAMTLAFLGYSELAAGDVPRAQALFQESIMLFRAIANHLYLPWCLEWLAGVAAARASGSARRDCAEPGRHCPKLSAQRSCQRTRRAMRSRSRTRARRSGRKGSRRRVRLVSNYRWRRRLRKRSARCNAHHARRSP